MNDDIPDLTAQGFERSITKCQRQRIMAGAVDSGRGIVALRTFVGVTQREFAAALGISVRTLQGWEEDRRRPDGPALALLRIAARHPKAIREALASAA